MRAVRRPDEGWALLPKPQGVPVEEDLCHSSWDGPAEWVYQSPAVGLSFGAMARTVDPVAYAARREAFVDAALKVIQAKGYEQLSVQDVIAEVGASKGAFFHYFDSKSALLAAIVDRMVEVATRSVAPIAADPQLTALE